MIGTRGLARTLIAGTFVAGGVAAWRRSATIAPTAEGVVAPVESALGRAVDTEELVKANAALQVVAGGLFALGIAPRPMALVLGASLVPTTLAGHSFWDVEDPPERQARQLQFLKNASILGGLVFAALDTGGRPSVFWRGRQLAGELGSSIAATTSSLSDNLPT
jgi:uncharacterized membrane protein YphA (DoxX/SURF4 family)